MNDTNRAEGVGVDVDGVDETDGNEVVGTLHRAT